MRKGLKRFSGRDRKKAPDVVTPVGQPVEAGDPVPLAEAPAGGDDLVERWRAFVVARDLSGAEALLREALRQTPDRALLHRCLADTLRRQGSLGPALAAVETAIALDAGDADAHWLLAEMHFQNGAITLADEAARAGIAVKTNHFALVIKLSEIALRRGDLGQARRWTDQLIRQRPDDGRSHAQVSTVRLATGDMAGAEDALRKAVELAPTNTTFSQRLEYVRAARALDEDRTAGHAAA